MISVFEGGQDAKPGASGEKALALAALCVGGMVLTRTLPDSSLAADVREAAQSTALQLAELSM
jgi:hypothetical protein